MPDVAHARLLRRDHPQQRGHLLHRALRDSLDRARPNPARRRGAPTAHAAPAAAAAVPTWAVAARPATAVAPTVTTTPNPAAPAPAATPTTPIRVVLY